MLINGLKTKHYIVSSVTFLLLGHKVYMVYDTVHDLQIV